MTFGIVFIPQIYRGDPRPGIPPHVMASSAMGLKLLVFGLLSTTHAKTNVKQMHPRSLRPVQHFNTHVSSHSDHSRCRGHSHLTNQIYFDYRKNPNTPNLRPVPGSKWRRFWDLPCIYLCFTPTLYLICFLIYHKKIIIMNSIYIRHQMHTSFKTIFCSVIKWGHDYSHDICFVYSCHCISFISPCIFEGKLRNSSRCILCD